jgi:PAS domain S-box-containing protein
MQSRKKLFLYFGGHLLLCIMLVGASLVWRPLILSFVVPIIPLYIVAARSNRWLLRAMLAINILSMLAIVTILNRNAPNLLISLGILMLLLIASTEWIAHYSAARAAANARADYQAQLFQHISSLTNDYVYSARFTADGGIENEWIIGSFTRITGYTREELGPDEFWRKLYHPDDIANILEHHAIVRSGQPTFLEYRIIARDGSIHWFREHLAPRADAHGTFIQVIGAAQEITRERIAEEKLQRERNLFLGGPVVIFKWYAREGWPAEYVSPNISQFGYEAHVFTDGTLPYQQFIHPEDRDRIANEMREYSLAGLQGFEQDYRVVCRNGEVRWIYDHTIVTRDEMGVITSYDGYIIDVTERKQAEILRREYEVQHQESQRLESLGLLAGGIAHDFNNMLATIMGNAGLALIDLEEDHPARESVRQVDIAASHAANLTRQLLAYAGKGQFFVQQLDLNTLIHEITGLLHASVGRKHQIELRLEPKLPQILADSAQITQVLLNLIVNASEALHESNGTITIQTKITQPDRKHVVLIVRDTGIGMDSATQARIFDPFYTTKFFGNGLGLAAVQGIIRGHEGTIEVESSLGAGTTFTITLPAIRVETPKPARMIPEEQAEIAMPQVVLVVDDEPEILKLVQRILERNQFKVLTANGGEAALELFEQHVNNIGVVFLDLTMPNINGEKLLHQFQQSHANIAFVLMSGYSQYELSASTQENARVSFLAKPFTPADVVRVANQAVAQLQAT